MKGSMLKNDTPLLSIIIPTRNDNSMEKFDWNLEKTLNFISEEFNKCNSLNRVEIVIVDWGSEFPLHTSLKLNELAKKITRFIFVPVSVTKNVGGDSVFPGVIALNVGIRRARGTFIANTCDDVLWGSNFIGRLLNVLDGNAPLNADPNEVMFFIRRINIPCGIFDQLVAVKTDISKYINTKAHEFIQKDVNDPYLLGMAGVLLMHRDLWLTCQGLDEKLIYWGWADPDILLRVMLKYSVVDLGEHMQVIHFDHPKRGSAKKQNPCLFNPFTVNDENWGLGNHHFNEHPELRSPLPSQAPMLNKPDEKNFRRKHFLNLVKFGVKSNSLKGWHVTFLYLFFLFADAPEGSLREHIALFLRESRRKIIACRS